jgi:cholesterol transport system auxiliary component
MTLLVRRLARGTLLFFLLCCGCVNIERSYPEKHYFVIEIPRNIESSNSPSERTLSVSNLRISPRYADRSFVYRTSDAGYESDFYNQFLTAPDVMISEELRKGLAASGEFKYVLGPANQQQSNYVLEGSINSLYGDFRNPNRPAAVLEIEFFLYNENSNDSGIISQKRYSKSVPLNEKSPEALVKGWEEALEAIVAALVADFKAANL